MIDAASKDPEGNGEWGRIIKDALIPIHSIVLPSGKVLAFGTDGTGGDFDARFVQSIYDPATDEPKVLPSTTGTNLFCSNMAIDPETGNVIIMGGDNAYTGEGSGTWSGRNDVVMFDYKTQTIRNVSEEDSNFALHQARWYGTTVTLSNGEILIVGGRDENNVGSTYAEIRGASDDPNANQAPVVDVQTSALAGGVTELTEGGASDPAATLSSAGSIRFRDPDDAGAVPTVSVVPRGDDYKGALAIGSVGADSVGWTFSVADAAVNDLASGEQRVQTYDVTIADGKGGRTTQAVTVTITGTNDAPRHAEERNRRAVPRNGRRRLHPRHRRSRCDAWRSRRRPFVGGKGHDVIDQGDRLKPPWWPRGALSASRREERRAERVLRDISS